MDYIDLVKYTREGNIQKVEELLNSGFDINNQSNSDYGQYLLTYCMDAPNAFEVFKYLIDKGADPSLEVDMSEHGVKYNVIEVLHGYVGIFSDKSFDDMATSEKIGDMINLYSWLKEYDTQKMLISKFPLLFKTYKKLYLLHPDIIKEFPHFNAINDLNLL